MPSAPLPYRDFYFPLNVFMHLLTLEEGAVGGFGSHVLNHLATSGALDRGLKVRPLAMPDRFVDHDKPEKQYAAAGLDAAGIVNAVFSALGREAGPASLRA